MTQAMSNHLKRLLFTLFGAYHYEEIRHVIAHRRIPQLKNPITFNDKIGYRKLFDRHPLDLVVTNKRQVRDFVADRVGCSFLSDLYFCGDEHEAIPMDMLPDSFVMKATHGSGPEFVLFFHNKQEMSAHVVRTAAHQLLQREYGVLTNETWYAQMPSQIIIEELLQDASYPVPLDYKFFVFNGVTKFIQVDYARFQLHTRTLYNLDWQAQDVTYKYPRGPISPKPQPLSEMVRIAETLAQGFDFVRVDLYCLNNERIVFGEITLAPEAGWGRFYPRIWDERLGELWLI
jgi:hypothetical protein